jgi:hypothetical protein
MIHYVPSSAAAALTSALWGLARPEHLRTADDTSEMFGWVDDLQTPPKRWLEVDTEFTIIVHPEAVLDGIADILQPWIDDGSLPSDTNTVLDAFIQSKRGQALTVYDAFPPLFKSMSKTHAEMVAAGWLPNPEVTP